MNSQASLGSYKVKFLNGNFGIKNVHSGVSLTSGFQKCSFYFFVGSRNAKNMQFEKKNDVIIFVICAKLRLILI